jgi:hypothetical protein
MRDDTQPRTEFRRVVRARALAVVAIAFLAFPSLARAQGAATEGVVVQVENDDLVVDLGWSRGSAVGDEVEIWRPLRLHHPVTGRVITDRFLIGKLRLVQVRPNMSLAKPEGDLARPPEAGDVIVLAKPATSAPSTEDLSPRHGALPAPPASSPAVAPAPSTAVAPSDPEAALLTQLFDSLQGSSVPARIRAYESYVYAHPQSRYVKVLWAEARDLHKLVDGGGVAQRAPAVASAEAEPLSAEAQPVERVVAGTPLSVAVALHGPASGAVLHARRSGQETYTSLPMVKVGPEYWSATIPSETVQAPALEWFIEGVASDGTHPVIGDPTTPHTADVQDVQPKQARKVLGQAQIWTDYASFNTKAPNDYVWQTEGYMGARFDDVGVRALRTGFGVYRGVGGTLADLDSNDPRRNQGTSVGLTYGYLETEFGIVPTFSIVARGLMGLREDGLNGGASGFVRIGSDLKTNLLLGGEVLGGIGLRGVTEFDWNVFERWPIMLRSEVTNQPAGVGSDVGVRLIGQAGYKLLPHLVLSARASYQGRTISHAGPGAGAALGYTW